MMTRNETTLPQGACAVTTDEEREILERLIRKMEPGKPMEPRRDEVIHLQDLPRGACAVTTDEEREVLERLIRAMESGEGIVVGWDGKTHPEDGAGA